MTTMAVVPEHELTLADLRNRADEVAAVAARRGASNVRVFGSVARGDTRPGSDVDLLVDLEPGRSLVDLGGLLMDLTELLGVEVDIVTVASLRPRVRSRVLSEAVAL
jgi:predicted nucleotidyltransferase